MHKPKKTPSDDVNEYKKKKIKAFNDKMDKHYLSGSDLIREMDRLDVCCEHCGAMKSIHGCLSCFKC